eukprot:gene2364-4581_t
MLGRYKFLTAYERRKVMHISTGPIFLFTWPLFSNTASGKLAATAVPAMITLKFFLVGMGVIKDDDAVRTMSRSGDRRELLTGPTLYGIVFALATFLFWMKFRAVIALGCLCFGDGMAELCGRKFGKAKLPWSKLKSWAGSLGFVVSATAGTLLLGQCFRSTHKSMVIDSVANLLPRLLVVSVVSALIETIPVAEIDNLTIFVSAVISDYVYCTLKDNPKNVFTNLQHLF